MAKYISFTRVANLSPGEVLAGYVCGESPEGVKGDDMSKLMRYVAARTVLDNITRANTGFRYFSDLLYAGGDYRPTIRCNDAKVYKGDERMDMCLLADAYDMAQTIRGDARRVFGRG